MKYIVYSLLIFFTITGCSRRPAPSSKNIPTVHYNTPKASSADKTSTRTQVSTNLARLYKQYHNWKGTPYKYGGLSQNGVDCSGFIHQTYRSLFKITLPRRTQDQVKEGKRVYINQLHAGDLVFFKTGWNIRHVGIYLEKGKFVHASSSKGVTISNMHTGYWKKNYWQARRLL